MKRYLWVIIFLSFSTLLIKAQRHSSQFDEKFLRAEQLIEKGDFPSATILYKELLEEDPDNANLNFKMGYCYLNTVLEKIKAIEYLEKAAKDVDINADVDNPDELAAPVETWYFLAMAYAQDYKFDRALDILDTLKRNYPNYKKDFLENIDEMVTYCKKWKGINEISYKNANYQSWWNYKF